MQQLLTKKISLFFALQFFMFHPACYATNFSLATTMSSGYNLQATAISPLAQSFADTTYLALTGAYDHQRHHSLGTGIGYRLLTDHHLQGAYILWDYTKCSASCYFNTLNIGIEYLSTPWDAHLNVYQPLGKRQWLIDTGWASDYGSYQYTTFKNHQQYDHRLLNYQQTGFGGDVQIAWHSILLPQSAITAGAYHFQFADSDLNGAAIGIEYRLRKNMTFTLTNKYDNQQRYQLLISLSYHFDTSPRTLQQRLQDPLRRQLATSGTALAQPLRKWRYDDGKSYLARSNIWFFDNKNLSNNLSSDVISSACTAENPCHQFNQDSLDKISRYKNGANIYLAPGNYTVNQLNLKPAENIFGRSVNYRQPLNQVALQGSISLASNSSLNDLNVISNKGSPVGITINNARQVRLHNVKVGEDNEPHGFAEAIQITDSTDIVIDHAQIRAFDIAPDLADARAITIRNSDVNIVDSFISAKSQTLHGTARVMTITNLTSEKPTTVNLQHVKLLSTANSQSGFADAVNIDNHAFNAGSSLSILHSELVATANAAVAYAVGLSNFSHENAVNYINLKNSTISALSKGNQSTTVGIKNGGELFSKSVFQLADSMITTSSKSENTLSNSIGIQTDPAFDAIATYKINRLQISTQAQSNSGTAIAVGIQSLPYYVGKNNFEINNSVIVANADSKSALATAFAIEAKDSTFRLIKASLNAAAKAVAGKAIIARIKDLGGNIINEKF